MKKLLELLDKISGRGYKAYKEIKGKYQYDRFTLYVDHVQADPFAPPSAVRVRVPQEESAFPEELFKSRVRKIALEDYLTRIFWQNTRKSSHIVGTGKSGIIEINRPSQQVLERSAMEINRDYVEARFYVGLPAKGRKIAGREAKRIFSRDVPQIVESSLFYGSLDHHKVRDHVEIMEDADYIRNNLRDGDLVAFVANGSILPRKSGVDERPLPDGLPFQSPSSLEVIFECPNRKISGMGIPQGVTLIIGGGYHGKSTLLDALSMGIYDHVPGDGREFVVTAEDAVKIRAEDGRFIRDVDISSLLSNLPGGKDTTRFRTDNASGSTSQAANVMEALELGSKLLLIDEDTSATNLLIRDHKVQKIVTRDKEPIIPLFDLIKPLKEMGISIILIMGSLGDYFSMADTVIFMDNYQPRDVTEQAKEVVGDDTLVSDENRKISYKQRIPDPGGIDPVRKGKPRIKARGIRELEFGKNNIDLSRVEQIVEPGQVKAIGELINQNRTEFKNKTLKEALDQLESQMENGLLSLIPPRGDFVKPRKFEVAAALNRLESLKCDLK
ncbi:MAG: ABC-ATPase domain-containing protein [Halobacteriota archaeon]